MPILFGSLTGVVLLLSIWIGYKNQHRYEEQISFRQDEERYYQIERKNLSDMTKDWEDTIDKKEALLTSNKGKEEEIAELDRRIASKKEEVEDKKNDIARLKREVDEATEIMNKVGGVKKLVPKIRGLRSSIKELEEDISNGKVLLANLKQTKADTEKSISKNEVRVENETNGLSQPTLKTTIKTVYSTWGFVTLNGGDVQGVVPGSSLSVIRGDEVIAKLKVTTVEPNRAAADILRESLGDGVFLRSGDKVVPVEAKEKAEEKNKVVSAKVKAN